MTLAGSMTIRIYDSEIHSVHHDLGYWIINKTYWYPDNKYTEEQAKKLGNSYRIPKDDFLDWIKKQ